jgi:hypothetical protein
VRDIQAFARMWDWNIKKGFVEAAGLRMDVKTITQPGKVVA